MAENEKTSKSVASIAARILGMENPRLVTDELWKDIQKAVASTLTQAPDRPKFNIVDAYNALPKELESEEAAFSPVLFDEYLKLSKGNR